MSNLIKTAQTECLGFHTRRASRLITRLYNERLTNHDLTASQLGLLVAINARDKKSIAQLSRQLGFDESTLVRSLNILEKRGLIVRRGGRGRHGRSSELTNEGLSLLNSALVSWQDVHKKVISALGGAKAADQVLQSLVRLSEVSDELYSKNVDFEGPR